MRRCCSIVRALCVRRTTHCALKLEKIAQFQYTISSKSKINFFLKIFRTERGLEVLWGKQCCDLIPKIVIFPPNFRALCDGCLKRATTRTSATTVTGENWVGRKKPANEFFGAALWLESSHLPNFTGLCTYLLLIYLQK